MGCSCRRRPRRWSRPWRIGDQHIRAARLDLGKTLPDRARCQRPFHAFGERIVTAGIQNHEPQALGGLDRQQHAIERKGLVVHVGVAFELASTGIR